MEAEFISSRLAQESMALFGTGDYESALAVLPAYDGAVKEFRRREKLIREDYSKKKG